MSDTRTRNRKTNSKKDKIVAIRMPRGLIDELRDIQKINHFMDISDEIRYVVRKYCTINQDQKILDQTMIENKKKQKLIEDLNNIIMQLKTQDNEESAQK